MTLSIERFSLKVLSEESLWDLTQSSKSKGKGKQTAYLETLGYTILQERRIFSEKNVKL
jgi:hypothetical protein